MRKGIKICNATNGGFLDVFDGANCAAGAPALKEYRSDATKSAAADWEKDRT
jgi:hypothetical protein